MFTRWLRRKYLRSTETLPAVRSEPTRSPSVEGDFIPHGSNSTFEESCQAAFEVAVCHGYAGTYDEYRECLTALYYCNED